MSEPTSPAPPRVRTRRPAASKQPLGLAIVATALLLGACSGTAPLPPPALCPASAWIPGDAAYALIIHPADLHGAAGRETLQRWKERGGLATWIRERFLGLLGLDLFDPDAFAAAGLSLDHAIAVFGLGLRPAMVMHLQDPVRFRHFIAQAKEQNPQILSESHVVAGRHVDAIALGRNRYTFLIEGQLLYGLLHGAHDALDEALVARLSLPQPEGSLGQGPLFRQAVAQSAPGEDFTAFFFLPVARFDAALQENQGPATSPRALYLSDALHRAVSARDHRERLRCQEAGAELAQRLPFVAAHWRHATQSYALHLALDAPTLASLQALTDVQPLPWRALSRNAIVAGALQLDLTAVPSFGAEDAHLMLCPNLGAVKGALAYLSQGIHESDASQALSGRFLGALYHFNPAAGLSGFPVGVLLVGARDMAATLHGFDLIFRALGATRREVGDGTVRYGFFFNRIAFTTAPFDAWMALTFGEMAREDVQRILAAETQEVDAFALLAIDAPRLLNIVQRLLPLDDGEQPALGPSGALRFFKATLRSDGLRVESLD